MEHRTSSLGSLPDQMEEAHIGNSTTTTNLCNGNHNNNDTINDSSSANNVTVIAKFGKEKIKLSNLGLCTTIGEIKEMLYEKTRVLPKRQKLVGLIAKTGGAKGVHDDLPVSELKVKGKQQASSSIDEEIVHQCIFMGTPEEDIESFNAMKDEMNDDVLDDFDLDFNAGSPEWLQHKANTDNLAHFTAKTELHVMNPPRDGKPLLVLDLDHTLLDFSSKTLQRDTATRIPGQGLAAIMKRPYMDDFLTKAYQYYDMAVWSQTSWRWLETKLVELGMINHPGYRFCFVLDKTSMFTVVSTKRDGSSIQHHVKPLQIIWSKFPNRWNSSNTIHIDDLERNFALNISCGLKIKAFFRKKSTSRRDAELLGLSNYLIQLAQSKINFDLIDFTRWTDVVSGKIKLIKDNDNSNNDDNNNNNA